ncbi:Putative SOS response-associated peptidase YedK [Corynebacterium atrinae]|uniref:SOS response-associated peptidase n=1 Tax=Corynebacterium atrinae TaxID=1336740 RepID=UPI0025B5B7D2|nr:SOS response-associated peptidase [Corynebacterium atrinae]WJY62714.1 Putative SOS response-associated peptidase YedK [Corynebacterium atrinae]
MCGRFVLFTTGESLITQVGALPGVEEVYAPEGTSGARYNIAPTQVVPLVRLSESLAQLDPARWGLLPQWKKDDSGPPLFNARGETIAAKPSFRDAFRNQRGLIPMDGYYEWHDSGEGKVPHLVSSGQIMWAAALWATGVNQLSSTIVTTAAIEPLDWLHDRLPRLLAKEEIEQWTHGTPEQAAELLHPTPVDYLANLTVRPVDKAVGNVRNDYAELLGS